MGGPLSVTLSDIHRAKMEDDIIKNINLSFTNLMQMT